MSDASPSPASRPNFPQMEEEIADFWKKHDIFARSLSERSEQKSFVFYDGPPFATGLPHPGHLLQSALKDAVPRYWTMNGYHVPRRWGWDCHGLPMEASVQKQLKLATKKDIEAYGIGAFNEACAGAVLTYASEWKKYVERIGRWVDFDGAYKTMEASFTESVWWAFAELWNKGLIYKDLRVSLFSPSNGTPLSHFEVAMENSYVDVEDPSIIVKFPVVGEDKTFILAWTTTPWTLPANVALAVHPDEMYVRVRERSSGETYIFAEKRLQSVFVQHFPLSDEGEAPFEVLTKMKGSELQHLTYIPLYPLSADVERLLMAREGTQSYGVVPMGYVSMEDGTGVVHTAPAFGEEDFLASRAHDLPVLLTVDDAGFHKPGVPLVAGTEYLASNETIVADLQSRGLIYRSERITHTVAIFARNNTRLMYKAQPAWYVNVTKIKGKMLDTAKKINWHPEHFKEGRFGKGLETAPDWCISRSRFWGAPLPVWTNADGSDIRVFSSIDELEKAAGVKLDRKDILALHRPRVDNIVFKNKKGEEMRRIPDVFDCWFESGSMPYASVHYPKENQAFFEAHYPADFVAEGQDQTRGWFYVLHVLSTALFGKPAFTNIICTGLLMAEDGKKMSKSLKNYADPWEVMTTIGADALRVYLLSSPVVQAEAVNFSKKDIEVIQRTIFGTLWNVRAFYLLYAEGQTAEMEKPRSGQVLDRWLMARLHELTQEMTESMNAYDLVSAIRPLKLWVEDLSTWWLRRSRERMKGDHTYDKHDALRTLREALLETARLFAPFAPFMAERLYQDMGGPKMSVHLDRWPKADPRLIDEQLLTDIASVRSVVALGHEARALTKLPVRQALASATVAFRDVSLAAHLNQKPDLLALIRDELNVERVVLNGGEETGEEPWRVTLDTVLTPELKKKGMARELARHIMNIRKTLGLAPQDTIQVTLATTDHGLRDTLEALSSLIAPDVKATRMEVVTALSANAEQALTVELDGRSLEVVVSRVQ